MANANKNLQRSKAGTPVARDKKVHSLPREHLVGASS